MSLIHALAAVRVNFFVAWVQSPWAGTERLTCHGTEDNLYQIKRVSRCNEYYVARSIFAGGLKLGLGWVRRSFLLQYTPNSRSA